MRPDTLSHLPVIRMQHVRPALALRSLIGKSRVLIPPLVVEVMESIRQVRPDHLRHEVGNKPEFANYFLQVVVGFLDGRPGDDLVSDFIGEYQNSENFSLCVVERLIDERVKPKRKEMVFFWKWPKTRSAVRRSNPMR